MQKKVHIVSFDIPYPPIYGGVIDVFFKIKALSGLGISITLHCFQYGKPKHSELEKYCDIVYYYKRNSYVSSVFSKETPFIVKSRGNDKLIENLKKDNAPILFDGLHTTYVLHLTDFGNRLVFLRAHNVEHRFYKGLAKSESNVFKRNFFKQESKKLKKYEGIINQMHGVFTISPLEQEYFVHKYGSKCHYIPAFHDDQIHTRHHKRGNFVLYHGNILVSENVKAAMFLIDVYKNSPYQLVIASSYFNDDISKEILKYENIVFHSLVKENDLNRLFENAHVNVLPTFQNTGIKLKLLNTLYQGKFIIANDFMVDKTGLESLCEKANTKTDFLKKTQELFERDFGSEIVEKRRKILEKFSPKVGAQKIIDQIFNF